MNKIFKGELYSGQVIKGGCINQEVIGNFFCCKFVKIEIILKMVWQGDVMWLLFLLKVL